MKIKQLVLVVSSVLIITGCFDDTTPPVYEDVQGVVLSGGNPLTNVDVHIRNHFDPGGYISGENDRDGINITIQVGTRDLITGRLYKNRGSDPIATFIEDTLGAGEQTINIPDSLLVNGILAYEIRNSTGQLASLFVVNKADSLLPGRLPFTQTGTNGEFILDVEAISVGQSFTTASGGGFEVTDSLQLIITEGDNILAKQKVRVLPDQSNYFEISID